MRGLAISINRSTSPQATRDLMIAGIIGFTQNEASVKGHVGSHSVTLAALIPPWHISTHSRCIFTLWIWLWDTQEEEIQGYLCHLVLVVEESVDTRSGAGVPNLHALVRWTESGTGQKTFFSFLYCTKLHVAQLILGLKSCASRQLLLEHYSFLQLRPVKLYLWLLGYQKLVWGVILPWDKVGVIWGEGYIKNPGPVSTQCASQVCMLPVKQTLY